MDAFGAALNVAAEHARAYLSSASIRPVAPTADFDEILARFDRPFPASGIASAAVIGELIDGTRDGLLAFADEIRRSGTHQPLSKLHRSHRRFDSFQ